MGKETAAVTPVEGEYDLSSCAQTTADGGEDESVSTTWMMLSRSYLYQNPRTGLPSAAASTVRQLCRILSSSTSGMIHGDTMVIGYDAASGSYSAEGWKACRTVPVLREACATWWYHDTRLTNAQDTNDAAAAAAENETQSHTPKGPVACQALHKILQSDESHNDDDYNSIRVCSLDIFQAANLEQPPRAQEWKLISELPHLIAALEAFEESTPTTFDPSELVSSKHKTVKSTTMNGEEDSTDVLNSSSNQMVFEGDANDDGGVGMDDVAAKELQLFLASTDKMGGSSKHRAQHELQDEEGEEEEYQSDGGTTYVKDYRTGNWVHADLAPPRPKKDTNPSLTTTGTDSKGVPSNPNQEQQNPKPKNGKKRKKGGGTKFKAKNAKCWIYVTGLPTDTNEGELVQYFSRAGIIELDPESQKPKIKLYRHTEDNQLKGTVKGDASICYARPESVELAISILDESPFRSSTKGSNPIISVQRAKFEQHSNVGRGKQPKKTVVSAAQRRVARLAALQAVGWDDGDNGRITGGLKGLRIIVLKKMFDPHTDFTNETEDVFLHQLETRVRTECETWGDVEKITVFSKTAQGIMVVKFAQPSAASTAVKEWNGRLHNGRTVESIFWDGVTDFTIRDTEKEEKEMETRHDEFGKWLDTQEDLPEEFKLQVAGDYSS